MLKQRVFQIAAICAAFMMLNLTVYSGERCDRPTDVDRGFGENSGADGHAEVVGVGFWMVDNHRHYAGTSLWGYVHNTSPDRVGVTIKCQFFVIELTENFNFKAQWYAMPIFQISGAIDQGETFMPSPHHDALVFRGGNWLRNRIVRAETSITVQAISHKRQPRAKPDEWFAWGCVDKKF